jgi:GMP synthase PP-ATPase subunit
MVVKGAMVALVRDSVAAAANRIIHEVTGVNRAAYDMTSELPGTMAWADKDQRQQ